jgi:hypothetical protein
MNYRTQHSFYVREKLDAVRRELFTGPFTVVAECRSGQNLTVALIEGEGATFDLDGGGWRLGEVRFSTGELRRDEDVLEQVIVYDDDWNALLVCEMGLDITRGEDVIVDNIASRWAYESPPNLEERWL